MKTGVILYLAGNQAVEADPTSVNRAARALNPEADEIAIIARDMGHWDVCDAWWALTARGMHRIIVKTADYCAEGGLRLAGREMRLAG